MPDLSETPRDRGALHGVRRLLRDLVAVLGAILVAFALDAWWDEHREAMRTAELLAAIAGEFEGAVVELDSIIAQNDHHIETSAAYLRRTGTDSRPIPDDSLADYVDVDLEFQLYNPSFGALSTLMAGGGLEQVSEPDLRYSLGGWSGELADLQYEENAVGEAARSVGRAWTDLGLTSAAALHYLSGGEVPVPVLRRVANDARYREESAGVTVALVFYNIDLHRVRDRAASMAARLGR